MPTLRQALLDLTGRATQIGRWYVTTVTRAASAYRPILRKIQGRLPRSLMLRFRSMG
jgi:hypothetical protein